ncbi:DUF2155 domain-containing protein [Geothermobacter hydrogeniphilus]|uniref:DUF2155 domain-containing protein n=1 Tax=Geothermobacter hydrogeniphilus TaxID=1969733 RepID=A0A2K2HBS7_9BACT|nr:DUF2155 domain-containing protein [Geothermobacter hydrogeniphilus]
MKTLFRSTLLLSLLLLLVVGCSKQEEEPAKKPSPHGNITKQEAKIVVPESVAGHWKAVKIAVQDKEKSSEDIYTVDIGYSFKLGDSDLRLKVTNFLPHFVMDGMTLTSLSNDPKNPAAQIVITEKGKQVFKGWLFSLYPNTHAFQHPRYGFSLVGYVPANGEKGKKG